MAERDARRGRCPGCQAPVPAATPGTPDPFPFCSVRCQLIDLGKWLDEDYRIADGEDQSGGGVDGAPAAGEGPGRA
ncbi:MAG: DNA gyrase inhibitor YacG [Myxococcales bacterium]|nr:DNA gyrase inhibitor YacG [Myxococcales bacterium]